MELIGVLHLYVTVYININISLIYMLYNLLLKIGSYGAFILFFISLYLLINKQNGLYYYIVGYFLSIILNIVLKGIFKQPRPMYDKDIFNVALNYTKKHNFILPYDIYGMPSGYAQSVFYSTAFIYLMFKNIKITIFYLIISLITIFQRVEELWHTVFQVIIGSLIGIFFGYFIFYMYQQKMMGNLKLKKDDFAFQY